MGHLSTRRLTHRQEDFCQLYLQNGGNASDAAKRAGYANPYSSGWQLLQQPEIKQRLADLQRPRALEMQVTLERTLKELARVAFSDIRQLYDERGQIKPIHELEADVAAALSSVEEERRFEGDKEDPTEVRTKKVRMWDKMRALEMLSKHLKLFEDTAPVEVKVEFNLRDMLKDLTEDERTLLRRLAEKRASRTDLLIEGTRSD